MIPKRPKVINIYSFIFQGLIYEAINKSRAGWSKLRVISPESRTSPSKEQGDYTNPPISLALCTAIVKERCMPTFRHFSIFIQQIKMSTQPDDYFNIIRYSLLRRYIPNPFVNFKVAFPQDSLVGHKTSLKCVAFKMSTPILSSAQKTKTLSLNP